MVIKNLNKTAVDSIPYRQSGQIFYREVMKTGPNPADKKKQQRRGTAIKSTELAAFIEGVNQLQDTDPGTEIARNYLLLLLFTGLHKQQAEKLKWEQVDFNAKTLTLTDAGNQEPAIIPLSDYLLDILKIRYVRRVNVYVFPGDGSKGYIVDPRRQMETVKKLSAVSFALQDLRRTFITIAESLDISSCAVKQLIGHEISAEAVEAGYISTGPERLRRPMQKITDYILAVAGLKPKAEVIELSVRRRMKAYKKVIKYFPAITPQYS